MHHARETILSHIVRLPGLIDVHVHLRTPGAPQKEGFATGTAAALAGGFTTVLAMPNTHPAVVDAASFESCLALARPAIRCDVGFYVGATETNAQEAAQLAPRTVGLKMYLGQTYGPLLLSQLAAVMAHFQTWPGRTPIAVHAEGLLLAAAIGLSRLSGISLHCCHISRKAEVLLIRRAKEGGARVTCEVTPHHLFLTDEDARALGPLGFMKPTLGSASDRQALWDNLDVVDIVASDHAPHTREEKAQPDPPPGVPGLETTLPLMLTAVNEGRLSMERLRELLVENPARIFALPSSRDTHIEIDLQAKHTLGDRPLFTRCGWTPFAGYPARGRLQRVFVKGRLAFDDGQVLLEPGSGGIVHARGSTK